MIVVTIEKWPNGNPHEKRELGRIEIVNDGEGDVDVSSYDIALKQQAGLSSRYDTVKQGRVEGFPRGKYNPDANPFALLFYSLRACLMPKRD